jgi:hypothetical protein
MFEKLKELHEKLHEQGIKLWYLRDPLTKTPSVSLTMMMVAFAMNVFGLVNKFGKWFPNVEGASELLIVTAGLYLGRSFSTKSGSSEVKPDDK